MAASVNPSVSSVGMYFLERVHGEIGAAFGHRVLDLADEQSLAAEILRGADR